MNRKLRFVLIISGALVSALCVLLLLSYFLVQTEWFKNRVRDKIISAAQNATGGRVELGGFDYDWHTLSADFRHFTIHGTEPANADPLFRTDSLRVKLRIVSLLKKEVDLVSVVLTRPRIYLLFGADGSTNIPSPKSRAPGKPLDDRLLALRVGHLAIEDGQLTTDVQRVPLNARGDNLNVVVDYRSSDPRYEIQLSSRQVHVDSTYSVPVAADLDASLQFSKDRLSFSNVRVAVQHSNFRADGVLSHFRSPMVDVRLTSEVAAGEVARIFHIPNLTRGDVRINGSAHYERARPLVFAGTVKGRNVAYESQVFTIRGGSLQGDLRADLAGVALPRFSADAVGSHVTGSAVLRGYRRLAVEGAVSGLNIGEVSAFVVPQKLPWRGIAEGPFRIEGTVSRTARDFTIQSSVNITPSQGAIPVGGSVELVYRQTDNSLEFLNSHLEFPHSQLAASGVLNRALQVSLDSTDLNDLAPFLQFVKRGAQAQQLPVALQSGSAHFKGAVSGLLQSPIINGAVDLVNFKFGPELWDQLHTRITVSAASLDFAALKLTQGPFQVSGSGHLGLSNWLVTNQSPLRIRGDFAQAEVSKLLPEYFNIRLPVVRGVAGGSANIGGTLLDPTGTGSITVDSLNAYGEQLNRISAAVRFGGEEIQVADGRVRAGAAVLTFSGSYKRSPRSWQEGQAMLKLDSNGFPLTSMSSVQRYDPNLAGLTEVHGQVTARVTKSSVEPANVTGTVAFRKITLGKVLYGNVLLEAATRGSAVEVKIAGDLHGSPLSGRAAVRLTSGYPAEGEIRLARIDAESIAALINTSATVPLPVTGFLDGAVTFNGMLQHPDQMRASARIDHLQVTPKSTYNAYLAGNDDRLVLRNLAPIVIETADGVAQIRQCQLGGNETSLSIRGSVPYGQPGLMTIKADGSLDLRLFQLADSNLQSAGRSTLSASIGGTLKDPTVTGVLELKNASFFLNSLPNGLSGVNGTLRFDRSRATIQTLTAHSGGGDLSVNGFVAFGGRGPLVYQLAASASNVRVRYPGGISVTADSDLRFAGTSESSLISGTVTVAKASFTPSTDIGSLLAASTAPTASPTNPNDILHGVQLDIRVESAPNLQLSTTLSQDVESEIDLTLRGTPDRPDVLGRISVNQGDIKVFGTKYTINRGEINFFNPAKIEPVLDLDLQTQARGITVDITVSGTLSKLNINYRSDPPLQPRDIVALLTVGRTPGTLSTVGNTQITNDASALQSGANTVLGQAISPVSNRLSRLFGITNIKIDPLVQGITNTPQARLTVEQQISRDITVTYITNLSQTSEQIFRLEWALTRQYSLVALRDDNGEFGIDILFRKRFK